MIGLRRGFSATVERSVGIVFGEEGRGANEEQEDEGGGDPFPESEVPEGGVGQGMMGRP